MESSPKSVDDVVDEIMRIHKSLPARPGIDEVEAAKALIQNVEKEDQARLEAIARQKKSAEVPEELFTVLQEMQKNLIQFRGKEQKSEALQLVDLEKVHSLSDKLIQRASKCLPSTLASKSRQTSHPVASTSSSGLDHDIKVPAKPPELFTRDDSYVKEAKSTFYAERIGSGLRSSDVSTSEISDLSLKFPSTSGQDGEKLSLIKLAGLIEVSKRKGDPDLNLRSKLTEEVEWLPDSIGKLSSLITLDLSENRILALPATIKGLVSLIKLDLHSNKIVELPDSIGDLLSLVYLDLSVNYIAYLPPTFGRLVRLEELNLSSNGLRVLPESIGSLVNLKKLYVETNNLEEIPFSTTIGRCSSLKELRADYNKLKALPEAIGLIASLEILSLRYNNIKQLPISVMNLRNLKEIDLSFNELESVPENLCFARTLVKVNLSNNFADLRALPSSIGQLEMLEELDISNNQIRVLPDSFGYLAQLRVLNLEGNPLEEPPRNVAEMGAQAVVEYMAELAAREYALQAARQRRRNLSPMCCFSKSN